ncbi:MAG TPA: DUF4147 domain-containing protein, partial [Enhygromyxa sp.]|nr:DUF4147 domain-containing protein [Enhygromyxa sp.]
MSDWTERLIAGSPGLARHPHGRTIAAIAGEALAAVDPRACVLRSTHLLRKPAGEAAVIGEYVFDLAAEPERAGPHEHGSIHVFGAGKASAAMASALLERFGARVAGGLVIVKHPPSDLEPRRVDDPEGVIGRVGAVEIMLGDHPIPGPRTAAATARLRELAARVGARDLVLCPISGGASALLSEPVQAVPPELWSELHALLLARDVSIQAINKLRRRFDALKAGGLARLLAPATVVGLIISDVVGDELALIGSGPTVYPSAREDDEYRALLVELEDRLADASEPLRRALEQPPPLHEHPRIDGRPQGVHQVLLARNGDAREAACRRARAEGLDSIVVLPALGGLAADEGRRLAQLLASMPADLPVAPPCCLVT